MAEVVGQLVEDGPGLAEGEDLDGQLSHFLTARDSIDGLEDLLGRSLEAESLAHGRGLLLNGEDGLIGDLMSATSKLVHSDLSHDCLLDRMRF